MAKIIDRRKKKRVPEKDIIIFYHGDCTDGFSGAWAAWKKFGPSAEYTPLFRGEPVPDVRDKEIYFIDFMLSPEETKALVAQNRRVTGIDHHVTAKESVMLTKKPSYSLHHSGAVLAWKYFHPDKKVPLLLLYVEDRDLWRWKMPNSQAILAGTNFSDSDSSHLGFKAMTNLVKNFEKASFRKKCIENGKIVTSVWDRIIEELADLAEWVNFEGYKALAVNCPHMFSSKLGNYLVVEKKAPFAIIWHAQGGMTRVSLRSGSKANVAKIAEKYGGGGHERASGFLLKGDKPMPWRPIKK